MASAVFGGVVASLIVYSGFSGKIQSLVPKNTIGPEEERILSEEEAVISVVKNSSPAVVSIVISKDVPIYENLWGPVYQQKGTEKREVGGGSGFIVSEDGLILTNKHVVLDEDAEYTVFTSDGKKFPAKVLAKDPFQDLAIIKITQESNTDEEGNVITETFPVLMLGDSDDIEIGQSVIAIGNALAQFNNTVSSGLISGLGRNITASGESFSEDLIDIIQTDAAINKGNSGGPLLNLRGEVIGINTAIANDAQSIGFSIPINYAKRDIQQIKERGEIVYPFIGIRYLMIDEKIREQEELSVDYGVLLADINTKERAIFPGSPAEDAGLKERDIVLELNNEKITTTNNLMKILMKYNPGDEVILKVLRSNEEIEIRLTLSERPE